MGAAGDYDQKAARWEALAASAQGADRARNARIAAAYRELAELLAQCAAGPCNRRPDSRRYSKDFSRRERPSKARPKPDA